MGAIPDQSTVEAHLRPYLLRFFYILPIGWFLLIFGLLQFNRLALASAVVGAGPFVLYYLYQHYVDIPYVRVCEEQVYFDRRFREETNEDEIECIYPFIEIATSLINIGNTTARNCYVRVSIDHPDTSFFTRWTSELYEPSLDLHPGWEREIVILQLIPSPESLGIIDERLDATLTCDVDMEPFHSFYYDYDESVSTIQVNEFPMIVQRPMHPRAEEHRLETENLTNEDVPRFLGVNIDLPEEIHVSLDIAADDWSTSLDMGTIPLDDALSESDWLDDPKDPEDIEQIMREIEWLQS